MDICLWFALLTGIFAVTEDGRFTMIAIIPVTANLAICALLGSSSGYYRMFVGTIMALILVFGSAHVGNYWNWDVGSVPS